MGPLETTEFTDPYHLVKNYVVKNASLCTSLSMGIRRYTIRNNVAKIVLKTNPFHYNSNSHINFGVIKTIKMIQLCCFDGIENNRFSKMRNWSHMWRTIKEIDQEIDMTRWYHLTCQYLNAIKDKARRLRRDSKTYTAQHRLHETANK